MVFNKAAALEVGMPRESTISFRRNGHCRSRKSSRMSKTLRADFVSSFDMLQPLRHAFDMSADRVIGLIDPAELLYRGDHARKAILPPYLGFERRPFAQRLLGYPGMFAVAAHGNVAEQLILQDGIHRAFDADRECLEIPGIVDLNRPARRDNADDHASMPYRVFRARWTPVRVKKTRQNKSLDRLRH